MTQFLLSNFGQAVLTTAVSVDQTSLEIEAELAERFPQPVTDQAFAITLWDGTREHSQEILYCSSNPLTGTLIVSRGEEGSTPRAWLAGTQVRHFITAATITSLLQSGFIIGNRATEEEAAEGTSDDKLMTPLATTAHFNFRTTEYSRDFLTAEDDIEARRALGWASAVFSGTGLETTFRLPDAGYDTPYTRVYVDEEYQAGGYTLTGDQLVFDFPPASGTDNIVVVLGENFAFSVSFPGNNTVSADALIDGAVTTPKIAAAAVTTAKLADASVTYAKLQSASAGDKVIGRGSGGAGALGEIDFTSFARTWSALTSIAAGQALLTVDNWPVPSGTVTAFLGKTAPTGWIKGNGGTIGSASSGATTRANADTESLFTLIWNNFANTEAAIQTSGGLASTRGASAAADYAANKRLPVPDLRAYFIRGWDDSRGVDTGRAFGSAQTSQNLAHTHTGTTSTDGSHTHTVDINGSGSSSGHIQWGGGGDGGTKTTSANGLHSHTLTTSSNGGNDARPLNVAMLYIIKL